MRDTPDIYMVLYSAYQCVPISTVWTVFVYILLCNSNNFYVQLFVTTLQSAVLKPNDELLLQR